MILRSTFQKSERLTSRKLIEKIVDDGNAIRQHPFRLGWTIAELKSDFPAQIALTVPKRFFKRAVDRNRIKRLMREVYRTNKHNIYSLLDSKKIQCALLLVYTGRHIPEFKEVEKKLLLTLQRFEKTISETSG